MWCFLFGNLLSLEDDSLTPAATVVKVLYCENANALWKAWERRRASSCIVAQLINYVTQYRYRNYAATMQLRLLLCVYFMSCRFIRDDYEQLRTAGVVKRVLL